MVLALAWWAKLGVSALAAVRWPWLAAVGSVAQPLPLFLYALLGAVGTQCLLDRSLRLRALLPLDRATTSSICNTATDFLIVSAIATIEPQAVLDAAVPFVVCCAVGVAWVLFAFVAFAKRLLPDYWVERGVTEFGLSLGATATALLLLRMMDPENGTLQNAIVCRKSSRVFAGSANLRSAWRRDAGAARLLL